MIPKDKELASICKKCPHLDYYLKTGKSIGIECERAILTNTEHQCRYKPNNSDNMADKKICVVQLINVNITEADRLGKVIKKAFKDNNIQIIVTNKELKFIDKDKLLSALGIKNEPIKMVLE